MPFFSRLTATSKMPTLSSEELEKDLTSRGLVEHTSAPLTHILKEKRTVYLGIDPSADSLQAGNLLVILLMRRLAEAGHDIVLLVGGGTGMIGDPKEKGERPLADPETVAKNKKAIRAEMERIIGKKVTVVDNADWLLTVPLVTFLRDIGKHFTVNELIKRDLIKKRLDTPDESISYTEFAYSLLQGYDFWHLFKTRGVNVQTGASDQWTNILSGVELIRRKEGKEAFALCTPLVTDANGKKFGKSEGNAVWLSAKKTSAFRFYQFWLNQPDEMIEKYLKFYTFLPVGEIEALMEKHRSAPQEREAQETLARIVTEIVHGPVAVAEAVAATDALYGGRDFETLSREEKAVVVDEAPSVSISKKEAEEGYPLSEALVQAEVISSKSEARRVIESGGITVNGQKITAPDQKLYPGDFQGGYCMIRKGKREAMIIVLK